MIESCDIDTTLDVLVATSMIGDISKLATSYFVLSKKLIHRCEFIIRFSADVCSENGIYDVAHFISV